MYIPVWIVCTCQFHQWQSRWYCVVCPYQVGRLENAIGWYHSHPGYGCWLSGIDVGTQMVNQQFQEPFVAIVVSMKIKKYLRYYLPFTFQELKWSSLYRLICTCVWYTCTCTFSQCWSKVLVCVKADSLASQVTAFDSRLVSWLESLIGSLGKACQPYKITVLPVFNKMSYEEIKVKSLVIFVWKFEILQVATMLRIVVSEIIFGPGNLASTSL